MTDFGVILWQSRPLVYRPVRATRTWTANYQGESAPVEVTPELRMVIEADVARQRGKVSEG